MDQIEFEVKNVRMERLHFAFKQVAPPKGHIRISPEIQIRYFLDGRSSNVLLQLKIEGEQIHFVVEASYLGVFEFDRDLSGIARDRLDRVIKVNCAAILFPFVREIVAETTRRAGLSPLVLDSFNFVKAYEKGKMEKKAQKEGF